MKLHKTHVRKTPTAITRAISPNLVHCELTHLERSPIDINIAVKQHEAYENALEKMGITVLRLPETPHLPDSVFVEDIAVVFPELGIITRPGAKSRRPEKDSMKEVLAGYRELYFIEAPGTLDGGDVLVLGKSVYIGFSRRSNRAGIEQVRKILKPMGYKVFEVPLTGCLHLKTAASYIDDGLLLINPEWVSPDLFEGYHCESVHPAQPFGANVIRYKNWALCSTENTETGNWLDSRGYDVIHVDQSELAKAEAGLTCCSVIVE